MPENHIEEPASSLTRIESILELCQRARVAGQVLVRRELGRVDEDGHVDLVAVPRRRADQVQVPGVQSAHGRDEADALALRGGYLPPLAEL